MKYILLIITFVLTSCTTTKSTHKNHTNHTNQETVESSNTSNPGLPAEQEMSSEDKMEIAAQLINEGYPDKALEVLDSIPAQQQSVQFKKLRRDAVNKNIVKSRYTVRKLYEFAISQQGEEKKAYLIECKNILEKIIIAHPEYSDMYSIKNNLKQIQKELAKLS